MLDRLGSPVLAAGAHAGLLLLALHAHRAPDAHRAAPPRDTLVIFIDDTPRRATPVGGGAGGGLVRDAMLRPMPPGAMPSATIDPATLPTLPRVQGQPAIAVNRGLARAILGEPAGPIGPGASAVAVGVEPPLLLRMPTPRYPDALRAAGVEGWVELEFVVESTGRVAPGSVRVRAASAAGFEAPAREAVAAAEYAPPRAGGVAVPVRVHQRIVFRLTGLAVD